MPAQLTPFAWPGAPFASGRNFGTRNMLMPLEPAGASGSFASTMCAIFSVRSCSPLVMNIFVPLTR